jgi:hypothetical protein
VNDGDPNEYPVGGVGRVGSPTTQTYPVGIDPTVTDDPADTDRVPVMPT